MVCWGSNEYPPGHDEPILATHQLGPAADGKSYSATPVPVDLGARVVDVGMTYASTYAVTEDGSLYAWGYNNRGQIGVGVKDKVISTPTIVTTDDGAPLAGVKEVGRSDGSDQCALVEGISPSNYACWGGDDDGELGLGDGPQEYWSATPVPDERLHAASKMVHGENHACAVVSGDDGVDIVCFGNAQYSGTGSDNHELDIRVAKSVEWDPALSTPSPK